jgi:hypothetical protein
MKSYAKLGAFLITQLPGRDAREPYFRGFFSGKTFRPKGPVMQMPAVCSPFS